MIPNPINDADLDALRSLRTKFGGRAGIRKLAALTRLAGRPFDQPRVLLAYHELLLFMFAHPDSRELTQRAEDELQRVGEMSTALCVRKRAARILAASGLPGSSLETPLLYDTLRWMVDRFGEDVDIVWEDDDDAGEGLNPLLLAAASPIEHDGLVNGIVTMGEWCRIALPSRRTTLRALLDLVKGMNATPEQRDRIFDAVEMPVRWTIRDPKWSRSLLRFPKRRLFPHRDPLQRAADINRIISRPLPKPQSLDARDRRELIDIARTTLALRGRETDPVTYADPREVTLFQLDRGVDVALFSLTPEHRLPLESFFGYVAAKNRVPVAYGGAWIWFDRAEIGINVFDTFRGGESAHLFAQIMRVYARHFGACRFLVDPFQFGADNEEGLQSGAYWFYHRLGYRPIDAEQRALAEREGSRLAADRSYRSPKATLRRLAEAKLELDLRDESSDDSPDELMEIALAVTHHIARRHGGDRTRARAASSRRVTKLLDAGDPAKWPSTQRDAFESLAMMIDLIPDLNTWPAGDRRRLLSILRAKGGTRERDFAIRAQGHPRLRAALRQLADRGRSLLREASAE